MDASRCPMPRASGYSSGMTIPVACAGLWRSSQILSGSPWAALDAEAKRERLLRAAGEVFAPRGPRRADAGGRRGRGRRRGQRLPPVPVQARAPGGARHAAASTRSRSRRRGGCAADGRPLVGAGRDAVDDRRAATHATTSSATPGDRRRAPGRLAAHRARPRGVSKRLLAVARDQGRLRADASTLDLRLLFAATRAAKQVEPTAWRRMLELLIDALRAQAPRA